MRFISLILMLLLYCQSFGQDTLDILKVKKPKDGIYQSFWEFRMNSPSILKPVKIIKRSQGDQTWNGGARYCIEVIDTNFSKKKINEEIWGFTRNDTVYVNTARFQSSHGFMPLWNIGRYCVFEAPHIKAQSDIAMGAYMLGGVIGAMIASAQTSKIQALYALNMNNANFYQLKPKTMNTILGSIDSLALKYNLEESPEKHLVMFHYVKCYNKMVERYEIKNPNELTIPVVLFRVDKTKEMEDLNISDGNSRFRMLAPVDSALIRLPFTDNCKVCVEGECISLEPQPGWLPYVKVSWSPRKKKVKLEFADIDQDLEWDLNYITRKLKKSKLK